MYSYVYNNYVTLFLCPSLWYVFGEHCVAVRCTIRTLRVLPVARTVIVCGTKKKSRSETKIEKFQRTHTGSVERSASDAVTEAAMIMYNSHRSYVTFESPSERGLESIFSLSHSIFFLLSRNVIQFETILWQSTRTTVRGRFDTNETKCRASYKRDQIENWYLKGNKIRFVSVWVLVLFIFFSFFPSLVRFVRFWSWNCFLAWTVDYADYDDDGSSSSDSRIGNKKKSQKPVFSDFTLTLTAVHNDAHCF